ncbi:VOC family protein [uncultured Jatrophihabitans sp.]|uniref:VOC family protein n=1 Tax=uncultured Jatrophihabitans sp. TaxID=1610747 RepID=UPI0035CA033B
MPTRDTPWPTGTPSWVDLTTSDPAAARDFYAGLFGWQLEVGGPETGHYARATTDSRAVCGVNGTPAEGHPPFWATCLATDDAAATAGAVEAVGGKVFAAPMDVMGLGHMAVLEAPGGGFFGVWQAGSFIGEEIFNQPGAVVWNEFLTRDLAAAKDFYSAVFGYTYAPVEGTDQYSMIEVDGNVVGGIGMLAPEAPPNVPPHWRVYFSVEDAYASTELAVGLGATLLRPPTDMPYGRQVDLADPQGATFALVQPPSSG